MNPDVNELAMAVLKKPLHECSVDELQQIARQYSYFGPVQLLLAKKLSEGSQEQGNNSAQYEEQVQTASLYFQNRVWLHHLLNTNGGSTTNPGDRVEETKMETLPANEEQNTPVELMTSENKEDEIIHEPVKEEITEPIENAGEMPQISVEHAGHDPVREINDEELSDVAGKEETIEQPEFPVEMPSLKIEPLQATTSLLFEPFHTVDYFASQGIKFREEEKPKDRFGIQLKSFTEWLKTLKQSPVAAIATSDSMGEKKVEQMAEFSIAERHVITEAMAEVWKKQGNKARAEEIYRKLSLLDPSKSSYFAAKIEELKKPS